MVPWCFLSWLNKSTTLFTPTQYHSHEGTCPAATCALWSGGTFIPGGVAIRDTHIQFGDTHRHVFQSRQSLHFDKAHFLFYDKTGQFLISLNPTPSPCFNTWISYFETMTNFIFRGWMLIIHIEKPQNRLEHLPEGKKPNVSKIQWKPTKTTKKELWLRQQAEIQALSFLLSMPGDTKYVICHAVSGSPSLKWTQQALRCLKCMWGGYFETCFLFHWFPWKIIIFPCEQCSFW